MKHKNKRGLITSRKCLKIFGFLFSEVCSLSSGKAALIHPLNDLKVIEVPISQTGLTRITVKEDRISNVFGMKGEYEMEADEDQGQVFIRPQEHILTPISITLTTEGGQTQDLRLLPKNQMPEALILQKPNPNKLQASYKQAMTRHDITCDDVTCDHIPHDDITCDDITRDEIEELLYACADGRIPVGYHNVKLEIPNIHDPYLLIREVKNPKLRGLTFEVENYAELPWFLSEKEFAQKLGLNLDCDVVAVLMPQKLLNPRERMYVHVAVRSL